MKGQLSVEFLVVTLLLVSYISVVFTLFSSVRGSLQKAVDRRAVKTVEMWAEFIAARPEGTELRLPVRPFPGRWLSISCPGELSIESPTSASRSVPATCQPVNITGEECLSIESTGGGVEVEVC